MAWRLLPRIASLVALGVGIMLESCAMIPASGAGDGASTTELRIHYEFQLTQAESLHGAYDRVVSKPDYRTCLSFGALAAIGSATIGGRPLDWNVLIADLDKTSTPGVYDVTPDGTFLDFAPNQDDGNMIFGPVLSNAVGTLTLNDDGSGKVTLDNWSSSAFPTRFESGSFNWTCHTA